MNSPETPPESIAPGAPPAPTESADPSAHRSRLRLQIGVALLLSLAVSLPFLNKPFTIDDTVVLTVAEQILETPLKPLSGTINWFGDEEPMFKTTTNPPLVSYWLAPVLWAFGPQEIPLHLSLLPFYLILALSMVALAWRFERGSIWPMLFVLTSPAIVVSMNLMRDVPAAALMAAAVALFVYGCDRDNWRLQLAGTLVAGLAFWAKYPHAILVIILALYALLYRKWKAMPWLLVTLALIGLWFLQNWWAQGDTHLGYLGSERANETGFTWWQKLYGAAVIIGSCFLLAPAVLVHEIRRWWRLVLLLALGLSGIWLVGLYLDTANSRFTVLPGPWTPEGRVFSWQHALWAAFGAILFGWVVLESLVGHIERIPPPGKVSLLPARGTIAPPSRDVLFLLVWALLPLIISLFFIFFQAVRHQIPVLPPLAILAFALLSRSHWLEGRLMQMALAVCLVAQCVLAGLVGYADYEYADAHRDFERYVEETYANQGERVWFLGHWGWQMYGRRGGFQQLSAHGEIPETGDIIVWPENVFRGLGYPQALWGRAEDLEEYVIEQRLPLHTMTRNAHFYAVIEDKLPYQFGERETWKAKVVRVKPPDEEPDLEPDEEE